MGMDEPRFESKDWIGERFRPGDDQSGFRFYVKTTENLEERPHNLERGDNHSVFFTEEKISRAGP